MKFRQEGNEFILVSYLGDAFSVTIPPCHHELPVTRIDPKAFLSCKNIVELTLPDSITEIGDWAFYEDANTVVTVCENTAGAEYMTGNTHIKAYNMTCYDGSGTLKHQFAKLNENFHKRTTIVHLVNRCIYTHRYRFRDNSK